GLAVRPDDREAERRCGRSLLVADLAHETAAASDLDHAPDEQHEHPGYGRECHPLEQAKKRPPLPFRRLPLWELWPHLGPTCRFLLGEARSERRHPNGDVCVRTDSEEKPLQVSRRSARNRRRASPKQPDRAEGGEHDYRPHL